MKKYFIVSLFILINLITLNTSAQNEISVYINGTKIEFDVAPRLLNGRTMVAMRPIFEHLEAEVEWKPESRTIIGKKDDTVITMQIDSNELNVNDEITVLDAPPTIIGGRTLVPARAVAESLNVDVLWYGDINTVAIYNDKTEIEYQTYYNLKGESIQIDKNFENNYLSLGWSPNIADIETVCLYAPDGRTQNAYIGQVPSEIAVGWYTEPATTMYSLDGRTNIVKKSEIEANKKVGWYETEEEVTQNIYSIKGVKVVYKSEAEYYLNNGWRTWPYPFTATDICSFEKNSVDGIKLAWLAENTSGKTINYYKADLYFINPVGDLAYDLITKKAYKQVNYVGPIYPGENLAIYEMVGYINVCDRVVIGHVTLEYDDDTTETIWCGQVAAEGNTLSVWDGTAILEPK